ncbi:hypothetical protein AGMMS49960_02420 [Betaproteobacteria bacterium]|nr:hypothetical protein AGMMS49543_21900 [Betaproteobacteria bacterium]GHT98741.1 hypothetical protein AGMMS49960_02420 [Betaproteobacteria bacterium]GHU18583.1 hypothetical protein AGMMS50243_08860 [Betaproteobacteria bacterium]
MGKYTLIFAVAYAVAIIIAAVTTELLNLNALTNIVTLMAASFFVSARFVSDNQRVPTKQEKRVLVWSSLAAALVVSGVLTLAYLLLFSHGGELILAIKSVPFLFWVFGLVIASGISLLILYMSYSWFAGICAKKYTA